MRKIILSLMTVALTTVSYNATAQILDATMSDRAKVTADAVVDGSANLSTNELSVPTINTPKAVSVLDTKALTNTVDNAQVDTMSDTNIGEVVDVTTTATTTTSTQEEVIGASTSSDLMMEEKMDTKTMEMKDGTAHTQHPLCDVSHTPSPDVSAGGETRVMAPKMIPLSVELANQLNIRGFENIEADGPIGFLTVNDQGKVFFEGQDLSSNVNTLCASGTAIAPVNASAMKPVLDEKAPDGSSFSAMPGQTGFRMQPIVDGPSYKTPPKRKKAAPKKVAAEAVVKEEIAPVVKEATTTTTTTDVVVDTSAQGTTDAITDDVALPSKVMVDEAVDAAKEPAAVDATGSSMMLDGAVEEVLGTSGKN